MGYRRDRLYADGEKSIHSRSSSPQRRRMPTVRTHAVSYPGPRQVTVCGLSTAELHEFPDLDFETSAGQLMCPTCREFVARR